MLILGKHGARELAGPPAESSVGKRWKFRRDVVIYVAHRGGVSQRVLADVFDLPRSSVSKIISKFNKLTNEPGASRGPRP
jgi:hypothetical protein